MKDNQFVGKIVSQGERRLIEIPTQQRKKFENLFGRSIKITIEEI